MPGNDGAAIRKQRLSEMGAAVLRALHTNNNQPIPYKQTVANLAVDSGLTLTRTTEYLKLLNVAGRFEIDEAKDLISANPPLPNTPQQPHSET